MNKRVCLVLFLLVSLLSACGSREDAAPESLLRDRDREFVLSTLGGLDRGVRVILFSADEDCEYCLLTEGLLEDIAALAPLLTVEVLDLERDTARAGELGIDKVPGMAILGATDFNVRYYGLPTGYEFITFVEVLGRVAQGDPGLMPETIEALSLLEKPVKLTVFATKT